MTLRIWKSHKGHYKVHCYSFLVSLLLFENIIHIHVFVEEILIACQHYLVLVFVGVCDNLWRRQWHPTPVLLPGKSHGERSLVGCSPWGRWELNTTWQTHFHFSLSCFGEGNSNPLQCSCMENPRDGGAWWAAVYGVTQSRTRTEAT